MADVLVQFHSTVEELSVFLSRVIADVPVHVTAFRFSPFRAESVDAASLDATIRDASVSRLVLTLETPAIAARTEGEFLDKNPGSLVIEIGRLSADGLRESCLSARTEDEEAIRTWREVAGKLRKSTRAGAVAVNPMTGATSFLRNHRFTAGAKALDEHGVVIRPVAGSAVLRLGDHR